jgi:CRISPR type I-E-associated protein CasB/Cse2
VTSPPTTSEAPAAGALPPEAPRKRHTAGDIALAWWRRLRDPAGGDPGSLARLRRGRSSLEAYAVRPAVILARRLGAARPDALDTRARDTLDLARVLAHVKEHDPSQHPMRAAGWRRFAGTRKESEAGDDRPRLAEARFRRLLETGDGEEKVAAFSRLVALLGDTVSVRDLANDFLYWNHPDFGDRVRERWAFLYYAAGEAMPEHATTDSLTSDITLNENEDDDA